MRINGDDEREAFFAEIEHDETVHRPLSVEQLAAIDADEHAALERHILASREGFGADPWVPDRCGWWWCPRRGATPSWADLRDALRHLRDNGVDPRSIAVAQVAEVFGRVDSWASEYSGYSDLLLRLQDPAEGDAERLRRKWLEELQPLLTNAREIGEHAERRGRPRNVALRQAIALAQQRGWNASAIASALLLAGADRSDLVSLKKKVEAMIRRSAFQAV